MEFGNPAPLTRPTPMKRWISWRGEQKPLLALALPDYQVLERIANPRRVKTGWLEAMDRARKLGLSFVGLPEGLWHEEGTLPFLALEAAARGLGILLPLSLRDLPRTGNAHQRTLDQLVATSPALIAGLDLTPLAHAEDLDPILEEELPDLLRERGIPYHCVSQDPLGSAGRLIRRAGFTADLTGVVMPGPKPLDPWWLHASCLATRMPDRPCSLAIATESALELRQAAAIGLSSGMALLLMSPKSTSGPMVRAEDRVLEEIVSLVRKLGREMEEPLEDQARSFLFRETRPGLQARDDRRNEDTAVPSLRLLHRLGLPRSSFLFEEQRREPTPGFLHVPAHGPLREDIWRRLQKQSTEGCQVLITGLCLDGETTRNRLVSMGVEPCALPASEQPAYPHWMRFRPILDTGHRVLTVPVGKGSMAFLDLIPEMSQDDPIQIPGLLDLLSQQLGTSSSVEQGTCQELSLATPSQSICYDIASDELQVRDT